MEFLIAAIIPSLTTLCAAFLWLRERRHINELVRANAGLQATGEGPV